MAVTLEFQVNQYIEEKNKSEQYKNLSIEQYLVVLLNIEQKLINELKENHKLLGINHASLTTQLENQRKRTKMLQDNINIADKKNTILSNLNDELEETNIELHEQIKKLKECLKVVL